MFHRIGWWENLQETTIFDGKNHGFRLRFSQQTQSIECSFVFFTLRWWPPFSVVAIDDQNWIRLRKPLEFHGALERCQRPNLAEFICGRLVLFFFVSFMSCRNLLSSNYSYYHELPHIYCQYLIISWWYILYIYVYMTYNYIIYIPVVPHKAEAEVSKIGNL